MTKSAYMKEKSYSISHPYFKISFLFFVEFKGNKTGVINDPLGQTHSHASREHCFSRFQKFGRTDGRTDTMYEANDHLLARAWWIKNSSEIVYVVFKRL